MQYWATGWTCRVTLQDGRSEIGGRRRWQFPRFHQLVLAPHSHGRLGLLTAIKAGKIDPFTRSFGCNYRLAENINEINPRMALGKEKAAYTHGHHATVVTDHARRGAADSAGFLIPHIKPTDTILDVGCGPGSITCDLAALVPQGRVIGVDSVAFVLDGARDLARTRGVENVEFRHQDANALPFPDGTFDVVYCHQVLQHVGEPVAVLSEMRRAAKSGGIVAAREADFPSFAWYPELPAIQRWRELYLDVTRANGGQPNAGRYLHIWAREAGFQPNEIEATWSCWRYAGLRAKQFAQSHGGRILQPAFLKTALREKLTTEEEVKTISKGWSEWAEVEGAFVAIPSGEILCRKPS